MRLSAPFRRATRDDAQALADVAHFASEGLALHLWKRAAGPGGDAWSVGRERASRETGSFSYRNAVVMEKEGRVAAALIGYPLPDRPEPIPETMAPMFVPLQELENTAPATWYVNVLAAYPQFRGQGCGTALLGIAEENARAARCGGLSIIVSDANVGARSLYERCGYREAAQRPKVKEDWAGPGASWVLLTKALA